MVFFAGDIAHGDLVKLADAVAAHSIASLPAHRFFGAMPLFIPGCFNRARTPRT
jgi:hypothetical protein